MNNIRLIINGGKSNIADIDDKWAELTLLKNNKVIAEAGLIIQPDQIYIDTLNVNSDFRRMGYGTILLDVIKGFSRLFNIMILADCETEESFLFFMNEKFINVCDITVMWIP